MNNRQAKENEAAIRKREEAEASLFAECQRAYQERDAKYKERVAKDNLAREKLKAEEREKQRQEAEQKKQDEEMRKNKPKTDVSGLTSALNNDQKSLLRLIFTEPVPHNKILYPNVINLIAALGGEIVSSDGSHQHIKMISIGEIIGYADIPYDDEGNEVEGKIVSGVIVRPHGSGHNAKTLSQFAIKQFRLTLERAGFTSEIVENIKDAPKMRSQA